MIFLDWDIEISSRTSFLTIFFAKYPKLGGPRRRPGTIYELHLLHFFTHLSLFLPFCQMYLFTRIPAIFFPFHVLLVRAPTWPAGRAVDTTYLPTYLPTLP